MSEIVNMIDITDLLGAIIVLILTLVANKFIPYLKQKTTEKQYENIKMWVKIAVQAAEMVFHESGLGAKKKQYVIDFLVSKGITVNFDELDAMIESAVFELKQNKEVDSK